MALLTVVAARTASTRLPDKAIREVGHRTVLEHVVDRLGMCEQDLGTVIVATGAHRRDNRIEDVATRLGVPCFRGSEHDVLARLFNAGLEYDADLVLRVTADCPLLDPILVDRILVGQRGDITRIAGAPKGIGEEELITQTTLFRLWEAADDEYDREHVTTFADRNPELYEITYLNTDDWMFDHSQGRYVLDTPDDLKQLERLYAATDGALFGLSCRAIIEAAELACAN